MYPPLPVEPFLASLAITPHTLHSRSVSQKRTMGQRQAHLPLEFSGRSQLRKWLKMMRKPNSPAMKRIVHQPSRMPHDTSPSIRSSSKGCEEARQGAGSATKNITLGRLTPVQFVDMGREITSRH